jgi:hypothetical protein
MIAGDSMDYLVAFVRGISSANLFGTALEVTARRVTPVTGSMGGTVMCPSFFVAFALDQEDPEAEIPDGALPDDMVEEWRKRPHKAMEDNLRKEWPDTFERLDLETTIADKGHNKPDARFHVYMENEASASFSSDPPPPEDVFRVLMKSASTNSTVYLLSMHDMEGTPFSCVTMVTIQLVGMELPEPEELPPREEEEKEEESNDQGDPKDEDGAGEEPTDYVTMNLPIFLALVLNLEPPAETPSNDELLEFKDLMLRFFHTTVKKEYPQIKKMDLREKETKFGAGQPEARYNMCVEYDATLQFNKDDEIPEKEAIQKMIMEVNLSSVLAHIKNLEPLCFKHTTEVTMRQKAREKNDVPAVPDPTFEAAVDAPLPLLPPPPLVAEERNLEGNALHPPEKHEERKEKPKKPTKVSKKDVEKKKPAPLEPAPPPKNSPIIEKKPKDDVKTLSPSRKEERKEKTKKLPKKTSVEKKGPPSASKPEPVSKTNSGTPKRDKVKKQEPQPIEPPTSPTRAPKERVESSDIYCAMQLSHFSGPPTDEQMQAFLENTRQYFKKLLSKHLPRFVDLDLSFADTAFGTEDTDAKLGKDKMASMNFYAEFVLSASFREADAPSSPVKTIVGSKRNNIIVPGLPTPFEVTSAIVRHCEVIKYLLEHVRIIAKSDFASASSCLLQQRRDGH